MKIVIFYIFILKSFSFSLKNDIPYACRDGYYYDYIKKKCLECRPECYKCTDYTYGCKECSSGQYIVDHVCKKCINNCEVCENNYSCKKCKKGYFINSSNKCQQCTLLNCKECENESRCKTCTGLGIILDNLSGQCIKCEENCSQCLNATTCKYCTSDYGFDIITQKCINCGYRCNKCEGDKCIECKYSSLKPFDNGCFQCDINNCISCYEDNECDKCEDNLILKDNKCIYIYESSIFLVYVICGPIILFITIFCFFYFKRRINRSTNPINEEYLNKETNETIGNNDVTPYCINEENQIQYYKEGYKNKNYLDGFDTYIGNYS